MKWEEKIKNLRPGDTLALETGSSIEHIPVGIFKYDHGGMYQKKFNGAQALIDFLNGSSPWFPTCNVCGCGMSGDESETNGGVCDTCYELHFSERLEVEAQMHDLHEISNANWTDFGVYE